MLRIAVVSLLLLQAFQHSVAQDEENDILGSSFDKDPFSTCNNIEGNVTLGSGCHECYICNDSRLQKIIQRKVYTVRLFDNECKPREFCCYSQEDSKVRYSPSNCGKNNPAGVPRRTRNNLKSVLQGEYPWRTWIFSKSDLQNPICAGVYIDTNTRAILTSANCVDDYTEDTLRVGFTRHSGSLRVTGLIVHNDYDRESRHCDIAILMLTLTETLPFWAHTACLPATPTQFNTACIAVSNDDNYINSLIPTQSRCFDAHHLHTSVLCTLAPRGDYEPEFSSGLFCENEISLNKIRYTLFGIHLYNDHGVSVYTNISNYVDWIENSIKPYT